MVAAIAGILQQVRASDKIAGIFRTDGPAAVRRRQGFRCVTPGNDVKLLSAAARKVVAGARGA